MEFCDERLLGFDILNWLGYIININRDSIHSECNFNSKKINFKKHICSDSFKWTSQLIIASNKNLMLFLLKSKWHDFIKHFIKRKWRIVRKHITDEDNSSNQHHLLSLSLNEINPLSLHYTRNITHTHTHNGKLSLYLKKKRRKIFAIFFMLLVTK